MDELKVIDGTNQEDTNALNRLNEIVENQEEEIPKINPIIDSLINLLSNK
jgi:hypothetical protein